jgi:hypothetical protein
MPIPMRLSLIVVNTAVTDRLCFEDTTCQPQHASSIMHGTSTSAHPAIWAGLVEGRCCSRSIARLPLWYSLRAGVSPCATVRGRAMES